MAIENELKYVMPLEFNVRALSHEWSGEKRIQQAYLDCRPYIALKNNHQLFGFDCFTGSHLFSFETNTIDKKDFETLKFTTEPLLTNGHMKLKEQSVRLRDEAGTLYITYKENVMGDLIEVEDSAVDTKLFNDIYPHCVDPVHKYRYERQIDQDKWFVDFLVDRTPENNVYFVQAEVEMPEGVEKPSFIPPEIKDNILYEVPRDDQAFTNRNLSNVEQTKIIYASLLPK